MIEDSSIHPEENKTEASDSIDNAQKEAISQEIIENLKKEFQEKRSEDIKKFKKMHAEIMVKKEKEYKGVLEEADKLIFEQEKEIESLQRKIKDQEINIR